MSKHRIVNKKAYLRLFKTVFSAVDGKQRRDAHQEPPPRPITNREESSDIPLYAPSCRVLRTESLGSSAGEKATGSGLESDEDPGEGSVAAGVQATNDAAFEHNLQQLKKCVSK